MMRKLCAKCAKRKDCGVKEIAEMENYPYDDDVAESKARAVIMIQFGACPRNGKVLHE